MRVLLNKQNTTQSFYILFFSSLFFLCQNRTTRHSQFRVKLTELPADQSVCCTNHIMLVSQSRHDTNRATGNQSTVASNKSIALNQNK